MKKLATLNPSGLLFGFFGKRFMIFRKDARILWRAFWSDTTPKHLKVASFATLLYLISPIDLIPFTVPILGMVDDLILVPLLMSFIVSKLPQTQAQSQTSK